MSEIIPNKLLPPRAGKGLIKRPRLLEMFKQAQTKKLILLTAPAGYGKTTLMLQHLEEINKPYLWYKLDSYDNDPITFLNYLLSGIRRHYPEFAQKTLYPEKVKEAAANPRMAATVLINNLAVTAGNGLIIYFDDYHVIQETLIHNLLQELLPLLPDGIQVVLAGRTAPPLNLSRYQVSGSVLTLEKDSLRFDLEEVSSFLSQQGIRLSKERVLDLDRKTEGWPGALSLLTGSRQGILSETCWKLSDIYEYLASEVFEHQPEDIREFLIFTSILDEMTPEICNLLLKIDNSQQIFNLLESQQLFLIPLSGAKKAYRYHQLFREFLLERLGGRRSQTARKAGKIFYEQGDIELAVKYLVIAGIDSDTERVLKEAALDAMHQGRWLTVARWLGQISEPEIAESPWLSLFKAQVEIYRGELEQAESWGIRAETGFYKEGNISGSLESKILLARILRRRGQYQQSLALLNQVSQELPLAEFETRFDLPLEIALCMTMMGQLREAEIVLNSALNKAKARNDRYVISFLAEGLGNVYFIQGKYSLALHSYNFGLRVSPDQNLPNYYVQDRIADIYKDWGQLDRALELAKLNVAFKEKMGLSEALPSSYSQLASIHAEYGEFELAEEYGRRAVEASKKTNGDRHFYIINRAMLAWILLMRQKISESRILADETFREAALDGGLAKPLSEYVFGIVLIQTGELEAARERLENSAADLARMGANITLCHAYKAMSWLSHLRGETESFLTYAHKYLELAAKLNFVRGYLPATYDQLEPILKYGLIEGVETGLVQQILAQLGEKALNLLEELSVYPDKKIHARLIPPLKQIGGEACERILRLVDNNSGRLTNYTGIPVTNESEQQFSPEKRNLQLFTFGMFRVFCNDTEITATNWRTMKTRDLLAYLAHQSKPVGKRQILEELWSNMDLNRALANFHSTLYYLRQVLRKFTGEDLIIYSKKQYQLLPGSIITDRRQFEDAIKQIQKKSIDHSMLTLIEKALDLYKGDYLSDLDYFWLIPIQEELKNQYIDLTQKIANYYLEQRQYSQAVTHLRRLAKLQPYSEENLILLMTALAGMGDLQGLKEQYHIFVKNISEDLGLAPSADTKLLYLKLYNNKFD